MADARIDWEIYRDKAGEWRWRASHASNGQILAVASEGYADKRDCVHCATLFGYAPPGAGAGDAPGSSPDPSPPGD